MPPPAGFAWYPLDLRGRALHFTVDVSRIPCGCHGEVVFRPLLQDWHAAVHLQANMAAVQAVEAVQAVDVWPTGAAAVWVAAETSKVAARYGRSSKR